MNWFWKVSIARSEETSSKNCHIPPIFGFQGVAINIEAWLNKLYSIADL
jgi:hypothetical protein